MIVIFSFSSRTRVSVTEEFLPDFIIFKSLHIVEYAILNILLFRALFAESRRALESLTYAIVFSLMYAVSDELHQLYIPTRNGTVVDIFIDSIGILGVSCILKFKLDNVSDV